MCVLVNGVLVVVSQQYVLFGGRRIIQIESGTKSCQAFGCIGVLLSAQSLQQQLTLSTILIAGGICMLQHLLLGLLQAVVFSLTL